MSDILARLKAGNEKREMTRVDVPEYDMELYFPPLTVADRATIRKGVRHGDDEELLINTILHMAHDAEGVRVFDVSLAQRPALKAEMQRIPFAILNRISTQASGGIDAVAAAEISNLDADLLRESLGAFFGADQPEMAASVAAVDEVVLRRAMAVIREAFEAGQTVKNG